MLVELAIVVLALFTFTRLHAAAGKDVGAATANALALQSLERTLNLDIELAANQWLVAHPTLIWPAVAYYRLYYAVLIGVLVWLFVRHSEAYVKARRTFVAMIFLVLPVFWLLPMSPPRFALPGIVDIVAENDLLGGSTTQGTGHSQNLYSAMPSLHVGWAAWCAYAAWLALRPRFPRLSLLAWVFPLGMTAVVFVTGNHYVLDVVGTAILLLAAIGAATRWGRLRRTWPTATNEIESG